MKFTCTPMNEEEARAICAWRYAGQYAIYNIDTDGGDNQEAVADMLDRRSPPFGGLFVGLAQAAVVLFGYRLTGGAANPARWLGTVLWEMTLVPKPLDLLGSDQLVYWVGPILGALLGGFLYVFVMQPPEGEGRPEKR